MKLKQRKLLESYDYCVEAFLIYLVISVFIGLTSVLYDTSIDKLITTYVIILVITLVITLVIRKFTIFYINYNYIHDIMELKKYRLVHRLMKETSKKLKSNKNNKFLNRFDICIIFNNELMYGNKCDYRETFFEVLQTNFSIDLIDSLADILLQYIKMIEKHITFEADKDWILFEVLRLQYVHYEDEINELLEYRYSDNELNGFINGIMNKTICSMYGLTDYMHYFKNFLNIPNETNYNELITELSNYKEAKGGDTKTIINNIVISAIDMIYEKKGKNSI